MSKQRRTASRRRKRRIPAIFTRKMSEKAIVYLLAIFLLFGFLIYQLVNINKDKGDEYTVKVLAQQNRTSTVLPFRRGDILDRNGVTLATSIKVYNLILDPKLILTDEKYLKPTLKALNQCFGYDQTEMEQLIRDNKDRRYYVYQKRLSYDEIKDFIALASDTEKNPYVKGVTFEDEYQRKYPFSTLASQVIGFTAAGNVGIGGLEQGYDEYLNGVDGREYGYVDSDNVMEKVTKQAEDGDNITTTLDFNIQNIIEKYVAEWKAAYQPDNIAVLVMNPDNGEILAMTGERNFDLNDPNNWQAYFTQEEVDAVEINEKRMKNLQDESENEEELQQKIQTEKQLTLLNGLWRNFCISDSYEPGSTFKPFTVAAAYELGLIDESTTFLCDGGEQYSDYIRCHKHEGHGVITATDGLAFSCNDVMMQLVRMEGKSLFADYQNRFGFGMLTGVDLPGESSCAGLLYKPETMIDQDLAISSFGQGFNVTMVQLASAFSSVINGGYYYRPHLVSQVVKRNGSIVETAGTDPIKQTVTKETCDSVKKGLRACVDYGTGKSAAISGYLISGKTGTAQQLTEGKDHYLLSFIGFAPYDDPEVVCYVLMDNPSDDSSKVTGSLYATIMSEVLPYLNIEKDGPEIPVETLKTAVAGTPAEAKLPAAAEPQSGEEQSQPAGNGTTEGATEASSEPAKEETTAEAVTEPPQETISNIGMEERAYSYIDGSEETTTENSGE